MRTIDKGQAPEFLVEYRESKGPPAPSFGDLPFKDELRSALWSAQGGLCCYCQDRVHDRSSTSKIEHFVPQSESTDRALDWPNLWLACKGGEGSSRASQHCDTRKGSHVMVTNLDPGRVVEEQFTYGAQGDIRHNDQDADDEMNLHLHLNLGWLIENRAQASRALATALSSSKRGAWTSEQIGRKLEQLARGGPAGLSPYIGALSYWLRRRLRRM